MTLSLSDQKNEDIVRVEVKRNKSGYHITAHGLPVRIKLVAPSSFLYSYRSKTDIHDEESKTNDSSIQRQQ